MVLPTVLHLSYIITSFLIFMAQSQCKINGVVCVEGEMARAELHVFGCGWRQELKLYSAFLLLLNSWVWKGSGIAVILCACLLVSLLLSFAYLNLLLTLIFRHNKGGCCLLKGGFQVLRHFMQRNHWIALLLWCLLHWMESCNCAQFWLLLIGTGKCAVVQADFGCLESCIKSAKIPVLATDFFVAIWEGAASLLPLGKMQDLNLKLFVWRGFVFIREDLAAV